MRESDESRIQNPKLQAPGKFRGPKDQNGFKRSTLLCEARYAGQRRALNASTP